MAAKRMSTKDRVMVWDRKALQHCFKEGQKWGYKKIVGNVKSKKKTPCIRVRNFRARFNQSMYAYQAAWKLFKKKVPANKIILHDCTMPIKKLRPSQKSKKKDGKRNKNANTKQEQKEKENKQQNEDEDERYFLFQII